MRVGVGPLAVDFNSLRRKVTATVFGCIAGISSLTVPDISWADARANLRVVSQLSPMVIRNDRGGLLRDRISELHRLNRSGQAVRIEGRICYSTCTMYLGLPQTCVSPDTTFGFHGPSSYGRQLNPAIFERASQIISENYPPALRQWYMETGRYKIRSMYRISGAEIIALGVRQC